MTSTEIIEQHLPPDIMAAVEFVQEMRGLSEADPAFHKGILKLGIVDFLHSVESGAFNGEVPDDVIQSLSQRTTEVGIDDRQSLNERPIDDSILQTEADALAELWIEHPDRRGLIGRIVIGFDSEYDSKGSFLRQFEKNAQNGNNDPNQQPNWVNKLALSRFLIATGGILAPKEKVDDELSVVHKIESGQHVKVAPTLEELCEGKERNDMFSFNVEGNSGASTESEGLVEIKAFLDKYIEQARSYNNHLDYDDDQKHKKLLETAESMRETLSFIGTTELDEATKGLANLWKKYLDDDPENSIFILAETNKVGRYSHIKKSDEYIRDAALGSLGEEGITEYGGRIFTDLEEFRLHRDKINLVKTRVVLLDDWIISGKQMSSVYSLLLRDPCFAEIDKRGSVEINLVAATEKQFKDGLNSRSKIQGKTLPIKAYFLIKNARVKDDKYYAHITGAHSSTNYGFEDEISRMAVEMDESLPRLARVDTSYRWSLPELVKKDTAGGIKWALSYQKDKRFRQNI